MNSVTEQETSRKKLPFTRFHVKHPPVSIDNVPANDWNTFLSRIQQAKQHKNVDRITSMVGLALMGGYVYLSFVLPSEQLLFLLIIFGACLFLEGACLVYIKGRDLETLRQICKEEEEATLNGFTIECHEEIHTERPSGYYIYLLPSRQDGIIRVEVAKDPLCGCTTSPSLPNYDYVPEGIPSIPVDEWSTFWSKVDKTASGHVSMQRGWCAIVLVFLVFMVTEDFLNATVGLVFLGLLLPLLFYGFYCLAQVVSTDSKLQATCNEHFSQFDQQGLVLEYHKEQDWTMSRWIRGDGTIRRFLCLYSRPAAHEP